jgi:hypothetical protein
MVIVQSVSLSCYPTFANETRCDNSGKQWHRAQLPTEAISEVPSAGSLTVFRAILNVHGDMGFFVREDFSAGQHQASSRILLKSQGKWHTIFSGDVNLTDNPLVISNKTTHGFYNLCDPFPCCGQRPTTYHFDGSTYR